MTSMTISNMPDDLRQRLELAARQDGRTPDQEAIAILDRALRPATPVILPTPIVPLRPVSAEEILAGIQEGRE